MENTKNGKTILSNYFLPKGLYKKNSIPTLILSRTSDRDEYLRKTASFFDPTDYLSNRSRESPNLNYFQMKKNQSLKENLYLSVKYLFYYFNLLKSEK